MEEEISNSVSSRNGRICVRTRSGKASFPVQFASASVGTGGGVAVGEGCLYGMRHSRERQGGEEELGEVRLLRVYPESDRKE